MELHRGWRSERLLEFVAEWGLLVCNDPEKMSFANSWTFESNFGCKRTLDYILVDDSLIVTDARAVDGLSLGSDHRAVQACVQLPGSLHMMQRRTKRHWKTQWSALEPMVHEQLVGHEVRSLQDLEDILITSSDGLPGPTQRQHRCWDDRHLQVLRTQRRNARDRQERSRLSKLIFRQTRYALRCWRT